MVAIPMGKHQRRLKLSHLQLPVEGYPGEEALGSLGGIHCTEESLSNAHPTRGTGSWEGCSEPGLTGHCMLSWAQGEARGMVLCPLYQPHTGPHSQAGAND